MLRPRMFVLLVAFACLLTLTLPFCVPSVESKVFLPGGNNDPPPQPGGGGDADPDDIAVNSGRDSGSAGKGTYSLGDEHYLVFLTEEYADSGEEQAANVRPENARLLWLVLRTARQLAFVF